jgi:hypothetical protein
VLQRLSSFCCSHSFVLVFLNPIIFLISFHLEDCEELYSIPHSEEGGGELLLFIGGTLLVLVSTCFIALLECIWRLYDAVTATVVSLDALPRSSHPLVVIFRYLHACETRQDKRGEHLLGVPMHRCPLTCCNASA